MKKSTIFLIIFVAIFFTSTLVLIKLNYLKPEPISPPKSDITPTIAIDPLANWKSFTDDKLNIQFKYPSQYKLDIIRDGNYYGIYLKGANYRTEGSDIGIMSLGTFFVFSDNKLCKAAPLSELETLIIKNKNYSLYKVKGVEGPDNKVAIIQKNSSGCINFACYSDNLCEGTDLADFQSILSTFKFSESKIPPYQELLNNFNQKFEVNLKYEDEVVGGNTIKTLDLSDYFNPEFSKNGKTFDLNSIKQVLTDFGLVYNPSLDKSEITSWQNSYQSANLNCDLSGNEEFLHLKCYLPR